MKANREMRMPREIRKRINKRAYALAVETFDRLRLELEAAIAEGTADASAIDTWTPSDQRQAPNPAAN